LSGSNSRRDTAQGQWRDGDDHREFVDPDHLHRPTGAATGHLVTTRLAPQPAAELDLWTGRSPSPATSTRPQRSGAKDAGELGVMLDVYADLAAPGYAPTTQAPSPTPAATNIKASRRHPPRQRQHRAQPGWHQSQPDYNSPVGRPVNGGFLVRSALRRDADKRHPRLVYKDVKPTHSHTAIPSCQAGPSLSMPTIPASQQRQSHAITASDAPSKSTA